jgi:hypothetical protein
VLVGLPAAECPASADEPADVIGSTARLLDVVGVEAADVWPVASVLLVAYLAR